MIALDSSLMRIAAQAGLLILCASMLPALYRIARGPKHADRIIALDLLSMLLVSMVALYAVYSGNEVFLDVAIAYALVAFLGTVAFARYLERSAPDRNRRPQSEEEGRRHE